MIPEMFVAEVYRRMYVRYPQASAAIAWADEERSRDMQVVRDFVAPYLPNNKNARILEIGFGRGDFIAAALSLGYSDVTAADFGASLKSYVREWAPGKVRLRNIETSIIKFLRDRGGEFDFIYFSHVVEHIPKHSLLETVDALYWSLREGG